MRAILDPFDPAGMRVPSARSSVASNAARCSNASFIGMTITCCPWTARRISPPQDPLLSCLEKHHRNGNITYSHQLLGATLVHPDLKEVIPLAPEPIIQQDGQTKNDCERNATRRWLKQFRQEHPHLPVIVVEDALSANAPHLRDLREARRTNHWRQAGRPRVSVRALADSRQGRPDPSPHLGRSGDGRAPSLDVIRNKGYNSRMMTYATLQSDRREFLALTGLTLQEFQLLLNAFTPAYERRYPKDRTLADRPRQRCAGGGRKGVLDSPEQKLLFLLVYLKTYPLQVLMGELFGLSQPGVNYWIHRLLPVLRDALDSLSVLPERNPNDFAQSQTATGTEPRLIIDGTERRRQRPKSPEKQALHYSGKEKADTDKNVVIVDLRRKCIGFLSRTYVGKTHDKKIADSEGISYPPKAELYKDTGFQGYEPAVTRTCQAKKKAAPRGTHSR